MHTMSLTVFVVLAFVCQSFSYPQNMGVPIGTVTNTAQRVGHAGSTTGQKSSNQISSMPQSLKSSANDPFEFVQTMRAESEEDIHKMIDHMESITEDLYKVEMEHLQIWSKNELLAPYQQKAEEGLTVAKDQLKNIAEELRRQTMDSIESAKGTMDAEQLKNKVKEMQQVIEVEMSQPMQYFKDAADAIGSIAEELGVKELTPDSLQMRSTANNMIPENVSNAMNGQLSQASNTAQKRMEKFSPNNLQMRSTSTTNNKIPENVKNAMNGQLSQASNTAQKQMEKFSPNNLQMRSTSTTSNKIPENVSNAVNGELSQASNTAQKQMEKFSPNNLQMRSTSTTSNKIPENVSNAMNGQLSQASNTAQKQMEKFSPNNLQMRSTSTTNNKIPENVNNAMNKASSTVHKNIQPPSIGLF